MNKIFKRLLVGKPVSSHEELHHRLSKRIALAVFSSDALSSSAYATDEILLVLVLAGTAGLGFATPIALAVAFVLGVVIFSYRQTVKAYPHGGGAYIVAHENLGVLPGLIAASALLIDYVLTVAVSVAAGVAAVGAALPEMRDHRISLALGVVAFITFLNLRGLKESGTVFAIPTYGFLVTMGLMIAIGVFRAATGDLQAIPTHTLEATTGVSFFLVARAFASGSTALTGVEAISDGVPAFRKPEAKNASQTLFVLGIILGVLFLGITFLARAVHVDPHLIEEGKTVTSQIAGAVFGADSLAFYVIQAFTALILFLAANTAYADFPRLASILARDRYLPRALRNRGDRLAFSNGIIILASAAAGLLINYKADVHKIIPLYVVGVFTSFTLSQSGMVVHTLREKAHALRTGEAPPKRWRQKAVISAFGAATTFVVLIIVSITKFFAPLPPGEPAGGFRGGAWQVIVLIPTVAFILKKINSHYRMVHRELRQDMRVAAIGENKVVLVLTRFRGSTKALAFARAIAPTQLKVVAFRTSAVRLQDLRNQWDRLGITHPIEPIGDKISDLEALVSELRPKEDSPVTVILPDAQYGSLITQVWKTLLLLRIKRAFLTARDVVVVSVPFQPEIEPEPKRLQAPGRLAIIVVVSSVNKATMRALNYARSLHPSELKAMTIQTDPGEAAELTEEWNRLGTDIPLEIVDSPYRSLLQPLLREVRELQPNPSDAVGVVVPEFIVRHWWQNFLHNQTALLIKSALLFEPNVVVINVPFQVGEARASDKEETAAVKR